MSGALAIVLLLNGVQVDLPRPALLFQNAAWVPLRAVCERVGGIVVTQAPDTVLVQAHPKSCKFYLRGDPETAQWAALVCDGTTYVRARVLAQALGGESHWNQRANSLDLRLPWLGREPEQATREQILREPLRWRDRLVRVAGRHAGRQTAPLAAPGGTKAPGADSSALYGPWPLYFDTQEFGVSAPPMPPLSAIGRALVVTAKVSLDEGGIPFLKTLSVEPAGPPVQPDVVLSVDRYQFRPGELGYLELSQRIAGAASRTPPKPVWELEVESPNGERLTVTLDQDPLVSPSTGPGSPTTLTWVVPWRAPKGATRQGIGVWHVRARQQGAWETPECSFVVAPSGLGPQ